MELPCLGETGVLPLPCYRHLRVLLLSKPQWTFHLRWQWRDIGLSHNAPLKVSASSLAQLGISQNINTSPCEHPGYLKSPFQPDAHTMACCGCPGMHRDPERKSGHAAADGRCIPAHIAYIRRSTH